METREREREAKANKWFAWADFFRGMEMTIGRGKVVWTLTGVMMQGGDEPMALLRRWQDTPDRFGRRGEIVKMIAVERMRLARTNN